MDDLRYCLKAYHVFIDTPVIVMSNEPPAGTRLYSADHNTEITEKNPMRILRRLNYILSARLVGGPQPWHKTQLWLLWREREIPKHVKLIPLYDPEEGVS